MTTNFEWLAANEPQFDPEADTEIDAVTESMEPIIDLQAHNAVPTLRMLTPNGNNAGRVMVGSIAFYALLEGGFTVSKDQS